MARKISSLGLFKFDREICGRAEIAGTDEAGRGSLAGPLVAAAVVFDYRREEPSRFASLLKGLDDSKKLTPEAREEMFSLILTTASRITITSASNITIDREGLHKVNLKLLRKSLEALDPCPAIALVDGRLRLPDTQLPHEPVTGGDGKSACIAAASIVAKVTRDRLMRSLHLQYPAYGFDNHVGYSTPGHRAAIDEHGYCRIHRASFGAYAASLLEEEEIPEMSE